MQPRALVGVVGSFVRQGPRKRSSLGLPRERQSSGISGEAGDIHVLSSVQRWVLSSVWG